MKNKAEYSAFSIQSLHAGKTMQLRYLRPVLTVSFVRGQGKKKAEHFFCLEFSLLTFFVSRQRK